MLDVGGVGGEGMVFAPCINQGCRRIGVYKAKTRGGGDTNSIKKRKEANRLKRLQKRRGIKRGEDTILRNDAHSLVTPHLARGGGGGGGGGVGNGEAYICGSLKTGEYPHLKDGTGGLERGAGENS